MVDQLPKNVSLEALALSPAESRAFPRWYTDLLLRKRSEYITTNDVLSFVDNFGISSSEKTAICGMFGPQLSTLDPPQFYVFLRLTGHVLQGKSLRRELAFVAAPVPKPKSILSSKQSRQQAAASNNRPTQDMDSFMSLMTGASNGGGVKKRKKRVTFDSGPPQVTEAAHRSMGELLRQAQVKSQLELAQSQLHPPPMEPEPQEREPEPEPDQPIANNQFSRVNIESVLHHGQSMLPEPPAPRGSAKAGDSFIQQLTAQQQQQQQQPSSQPQVQSQSQGQRPPPPPPPSSSSLQQQNTPSLFPQPPPQRPSLQVQHSGMLPQHSGLQVAGTGTKPQFLSPQVSGMTSPATGLSGHGTGQFLSPQASGVVQGPAWQQPQPQQQPPQPQPPVSRLGPQSTGSLPITLQRNAPVPPPNRYSSPQIQTPMQQQQQQQQQPMGSQIPMQVTGLQPTTTGLQQLQVPNLQPGMAYQQPTQTGMGMQPTGMQPQQTGFLGMQPQQQHQIHTQLTGYTGQPVMQQLPQQQQQPSNSGMQFINSLQMNGTGTNTQNGYAMPQHQQYNGQAYNMQGLREQLPYW